MIPNNARNQDFQTCMICKEVKENYIELDSEVNEFNQFVVICDKCVIEALLNALGLGGKNE